MTLGEELDQFIYDEGIAYEEHDLQHYSGLYDYESDMVCPVITININIECENKKTWVKAHELGHHFTLSGDLFYAPHIIRSRDEYRANRWATEWIMPIEKLIAAYEYGVSTQFDLADYLDIPPEELYKGINIYYGIYGQQSIHGQYVINWNPFHIKKDHRRKLI